MSPVKEVSIYKMSTKKELHIALDRLELGPEGQSILPTTKSMKPTESSRIQAQKRALITKEIKIVLHRIELGPEGQPQSTRPKKPTESSGIQAKKALITNEVKIILKRLEDRWNGKPKLKTAGKTTRNIQDKKKALISHEVKIILDRCEVEKRLKKGKANPTPQRVYRNPRKNPEKKCTNSKHGDPFPQKRNTRIEAKEIPQNFSKVYISLDKNEIQEEKHLAFPPNHLPPPAESLPTVTPGPKVSGTDTSRLTSSPLVLERIESKDVISFEHDFMDDGELFSDVNFSPCDMRVSIQEWIQKMLIEEFGVALLDDVDF